MNALVIYDATGRIWNISYGETTVPQGLTAIFVDIPDGAVLNHIDVTDAKNPKPVFDYVPESDIGRLQKELKEANTTIEKLDSQLTETQMALCEQYESKLELEDEVTNTQLAICEVYEACTGMKVDERSPYEALTAQEGGEV